METEATQQPPPGSSAVTAAYPRSVLLKHYAEDVDVGSCPAADARTLAVSRTSTGHPVAVSLSLAAPPALSSVRVHFPRGVEGATGYVFAAHGDSLLICAYFKEGYRGGRPNYFVYDAGAASAEPPGQPSLFLLPPHWLAEQGPGSEGRSRGGGAPAWRFRDKRGTGLLRRGEDEFAAELKIATVGYGTPAAREEAELTLFRRGQWSVEQPAVVIHHDSQDDGDEDEDPLLSSWSTHTVLPVGDAQLCWVDQHLGLLF
jgi:hypothetical protein